MASIRGKIINPVSIGGDIISEIESPINLNVSTDMNYQASSLSTFLQTESSFFLPIDLSNINNIFTISKPEKYGQSIFRNRLSEKTIPISLSGNVSDDNSSVLIKENNEILYIDGGKKYKLFSSRNESDNFGWEPVSNSEKYSHVERSDFDSFDFPQVTIRGVRKIPADSGDTLCGPVTYTGETYERINYNWIFGDYAGIKYNPIQSGGTPVVISGSMVSQEGVSSISDSDGNLLFYTNGEIVYNYDGTIMTNGTNLSSSGTSTQSCIIVPRPNSNKYYIFTTNYVGSTNGFKYSIVSIDPNTNIGVVETKNITIIKTPLTEKVTACKHNNGDDYWVITHTSGDSTYHSFIVTSSGLNGPISTSLGSIHNTLRGYMKTSPDGKKLVSLLYDEDIIDIFDFDDSTGVVSNPISITGMTFDVGPYGLEFSSDSTKFYVTEGSGEKVYQFDLKYSSSTEIMENVIIVGEISGSSLGALQLAPDERIYVADYGNSNLHVIHRPNGLGVQCNFEVDGFSLNNTTITGTTSFWGLPNIVTNNSLSCDRYVYIVPKSRVGYLFDVLVNNVNDVVIPKNLSYFGEVYKYNQTTEVFDNSALSNFAISYENLTANTGNTVYIPTLNIGEGEFLIKSYWTYDVNTLLAKLQKVRKNSIDTYKRGELYGLYNPETDWYFISLFEADKPLFNNSVSTLPKSLGNLVVESIFTTSGVTEYIINGLSDPIVSYNGSVLAKNIEYSANTSASTPYIKLLFTPLDNQILTYAYVNNGGSTDLLADLYNINSSITSGTTGTQSNSDRVFYNNTENKYEYYLTSVPVSDIVLSLNGSILSKDVEYYLSSSDSRRIILEETLQVGDILEAFYVPSAPINGLIPTNNPIISWSIDSAPQSTNGKFTVEVTTTSDIDFNSIQYSFETPYIINQKTYSLLILLTNANAGDKFIYRVKNEKFYQPIMGETIYSVNYSDVNNIEIQFNSGKTY
jgi:hypothetical protein